MARSKSSTTARPDVASFGRFDALNNLNTNDYDSSDDDLPPPASTLTPPPAGTPSKKAAARKRAQLRKKGSQLDLNGSGDGKGGNDSDVSVVDAAASAIPPSPALPSKAQLQEKANGVKEATYAKAAEVTESVSKSQPVKAAKEQAAPLVKQASIAAETAKQQAAAAVPKVQKFVEEKVEQVKAALPKEAPYVPLVTSAERPPAPESVSSDEEEEPAFEDDDEEEDEEEEVAPSSAVAKAASPTPASPRPASPSVSPSGATPAPKGTYTGADHDPNKKIKAIIQRTVWGLVMGAGFLVFVAAGHAYVVALVFIIQAVVFKELTGLFDAGYSGAHIDAQGQVTRSAERLAKRQGRKEERERWSRRMAWYFFAVANYYLYGESLIYYSKHILTLQASFLPTAYSFAQHHRLVSFGLYTIGFVSFVATLNRNSLRRQFGLFGWIHMSLLLVVVSSHFIVNNILEGMIWFWVPASLVIINDVAAYVCGMAFGRHQLIKLSPKKTVEGFVGAFFVTILFAVGWSTFFMRFNYMICPAQDLSMNVFSDITCQPNNVFVWRSFPLPASVTATLETFTRQHITSISWAPFQLHSIVLAVFASLVAPFGGFFASGFKRAFNIKDFGDSIPGHGGMTDRMDCQFIAGMFAYLYYAALIRETHITPQSVLATIATHLTLEQQTELFSELGKILANKGVNIGW